MSRKFFPIRHPFRQVADAWATVPIEPPENHREALKRQAAELLKQTDTVLVAHYYVHPDLQDLAEETGGFVGDSFAMAQFGYRHPAQKIAVAGVRFMGETAKILNPEKQVIMPTLKAECSLDLGCPADEFEAFCDRHPDRVVVVYSNTSARIKARADWILTSSMAIELVEYLHRSGKKILWGPDKHLGRYVQQLTGADMILWEGSCIVHEEFKAHALAAMKMDYPDAIVLAHPESPAEVLALADMVGSTAQILRAARNSQVHQFIIATDFGIKHQLQKQNPDKEFLVAPTAGDGAVCKSCAFCPWMAMNSLSNLVDALQHPENHQIQVADHFIEPASKALMRMVGFAEKRNPDIPVSSLGPA